MKRKLSYSLIAILLLTPLVSQASAWFYNDFPEPGRAADTKFETFGPRCDRLLIKLYSDAEVEWDALKATPQELDLTDWPLTKAYYDQFIVPPYDAKVNVESVGCEYSMENVETGSTLYPLGVPPDAGGQFSIRCLEINQNPNRYLGIPPDPTYPNPVADLNDVNPKNDYNPCSDVNFRRAILSCIDRTYYVVNIIGSGFAVEHWSMLPPATGVAYYNESFRIYPFSLINAGSYLDVSNFKTNGATGYRYWDLDDDGVEDPNEYVELEFLIRRDDSHRQAAGTNLADQLNNVGIRVNRTFVDIFNARNDWMMKKDYHLYTAGWTLGTDPDSIAMWIGDAGVGVDYSSYWHPGSCYNTGYANDPTFNINARIVEVANSESEAIAAMAICNMQAARQALSGPMWVYSATQANARTYVGGQPNETQYVGNYWDGMVNVMGYGTDNYFSLLNMHPRGYPRPDNGTIRYGFKDPAIDTFNVLYACWVWETKILDLIYDPLVVSNPYNLNDRLPWLCKQYSVGVYEHPTLGPCTKTVFTLRNDATWTDGTPITTADVYFTFVESWRILRARGLPNPWWYSAVKSILSFRILDPLNFEVLTNVKSIWALGLSGATVQILPEHIWRPILNSASSSVVQGLYPDPNMISSGPWRLQNYSSYPGFVELLANKPGRTVQTSFTNSTPVTSPRGYFRYYPKYVDIHADDYTSKISLAYPATNIDVHLTVTDDNLLRDQFEFLWVEGPHAGSPIGDQLLFLNLTADPDEPICEWEIIDWVDGNLPYHPEYPPDDMLSVCDMIRIEGTAPGTPPIWVHVQSFPGPEANRIHVGQVLEAIKNVWIDTTRLVIDEYEREKPGLPIVETFTVNLAKGRHTAVVEKLIITEWLLLQDNSVVPNPWMGSVVTAEWPIWVALLEDIAGDYYINPSLPAPDFFVEITDVATAAFAFGAYPGHMRWSTIADLNGDNWIDISDIAMIAFRFGH